LATFIAILMKGTTRFSINMDQVKCVEITNDMIQFHFGPGHIVPFQREKMGTKTFDKLVNKLVTDIPRTSWS
jgi:hypothetical protein